MDSLDNCFEKLDNAARTGYLIGGFVTGTLTIEEREELDAWVIKNDENMQLFEDMTDEAMVERFMHWLANRDTDARLAETKSRLKFRRKPAKLEWWHYAAAACLVGIIGILIYYNPSRTHPKSEIIAGTPVDILPGSSVAELHLPSGEVVKLDGIKDTIIDNIQIAGGEVRYGMNESDSAMHEIIIPRKGFYKLLLPDGSKVSLNNESSIRYPGRFAKDKRLVTVTGETYFEIAKDLMRPFIVTVGDMNIRATGTAFNVNGFDNTVTLTEGAVEVTKGQQRKVLKPGEQLDGEWDIKQVDFNPVIAWTRNQFRFKNATIEEIMNLLRRWYDCSVKFEENVGYHFNGTIDRDVPISRVLKLLEGTGQVHFQIEDNTIFVRK